MADMAKLTRSRVDIFCGQLLVRRVCHTTKKTPALTTRSRTIPVLLPHRPAMTQGDHREQGCEQDQHHVHTESGMHLGGFGIHRDVVVLEYR